MSVNKNRPHVFVLPEDDPNRQMANGFRLEIDWSQLRQMHVLPRACGWQKVLKLFQFDHIPEMNRYENRFMVLLIDFDGQEDRLDKAKAVIPNDLSERVFTLGTLSEPEALRQDLGPYETIGSALAKDCREETDTTWTHNLLQHNASELDRLRRRVRPILLGAKDDIGNTGSPI